MIRGIFLFTESGSVFALFVVTVPSACGLGFEIIGLQPLRGTLNTVAAVVTESWTPVIGG